MRLFIRLVIVELSLPAILFISAGRIDLPWFWALIGVYVVLMSAAIRSIDPDLIRERHHPAPGGEDRSLRWRVAPFFLAHLIVAGLDVGRFGWSGSVPLVVHTAGLIAYVSGMGLAMRAMVVNRFFSPVVRIQEERGHRLITEGPYRFVRHPGYTGMLLSFLGSGLVLGSWWSLLPLIPVMVLILRRTTLEDRYLREHLEGYVGYAERVRFRLLPGVW
ncbi:MAG: isoprenylcysteine carboxylmethyltransferase family protein [Isosphaeraceae bacterium]|jgi:protein-S-isoprenylcysteine O-methyltransferase Ste14